jgi:histone H3/H4
MSGKIMFGAKGRPGARRHRKLVLGGEPTKPEIKRACRKAGIPRMGTGVHEQVISFNEQQLELIIAAAVTITEASKKKTLQRESLDHVLMSLFRKRLYGGFDDKPKKRRAKTLVKKPTTTSSPQQKDEEEEEEETKFELQESEIMMNTDETD